MGGKKKVGKAKPTKGKFSLKLVVRLPSAAWALMAGGATPVIIWLVTR